MTDCNEQRWLFQELGCRKVEVDFGGGYLSSDGGGLYCANLSVTAVFYEMSLTVSLTTETSAMSNIAYENWSVSAFMGWPWGTKISTIMITCGAIRCMD